MLIELSKLNGVPVGSLSEGTRVGTIWRTVVNPDGLRVIGFVVKVGTVFPKMKVVSFMDVVDIDQNGVVINSKDNLLEKDEVVRVGELVKKKFSLLGLAVKDKKKKFFGRVRDAVVETTSGDILRLYSRYLVSDFVFERSQVEKVTLREVVIGGVSPKRAKPVKSPAAMKAAEPA